MKKASSGARRLGSSAEDGAVEAVVAVVVVVMDVDVGYYMVVEGANRATFAKSAGTSLHIFLLTSCLLGRLLYYHTCVFSQREDYSFRAISSMYRWNELQVLLLIEITKNPVLP